MLFLLAFTFLKPELIREIILSSSENTNGERSVLETKAEQQEGSSSLRALLPAAPSKALRFRRAEGGWTLTTRLSPQKQKL